jgi:aspartyl-tRNA(Asn)/glutamyl-tRNA(Gln) amidotransferase subunit C
MTTSEPLSLEEVRKVAHLARLALSDEQLERYRHQLGDVLGYMNRLRQLDLSGVEPMTSPIESANRLAEDVPGPTLSNEQLMAMAPQGAAEAPFIAVPKVIGGGGGEGA